MIEVEGPPARWIVRGGRPSDVAWTHDGIPSYESDTGKILVYDLLVAMDSSAAVARPGCAVVSTTTLFFPRGYAMCAARSVLVGDHELCALHDDPDAQWVWRPLIHELGNGLTRYGSQQELEWRWSADKAREACDQLDADATAFIIWQTLELRRRYGRIPPLALEPGQTGFRLPKNARKRLYREYAAEIDRLMAGRRLPFQEANDRADALLRDHLCPQQRLDFAATGRFYVRGTINRLYAVRPGNGASIVDPDTLHESVSLCVHPERWIPHADVALATKLLIDSGPAGEEELLAGARARPQGGGPRATRHDRRAWELERDLLPAPLDSVRPARVS